MGKLNRRIISKLLQQLKIRLKSNGLTSVAQISSHFDFLMFYLNDFCQKLTSALLSIVNAKGVLSDILLLQ